MRGAAMTLPARFTPLGGIFTITMSRALGFHGGQALTRSLPLP